MSTDEIDFLDGLTPDPPRPIAAAPAVAPVPVAVVAAPTQPWGTARFVVLLVVVGACSLGSGLLFAWLFTRRDDTPSPGDYDRRFVAVGKAYLSDLGPAYATAWEDGAKVLDAGQSIGMALDTVAKSWEANRKVAGNKRLTPELNKVVAESKPDSEVTSEDRAALAKAYRGLAKGLGGK